MANRGNDRSMPAQRSDRDRSSGSSDSMHHREDENLRGVGDSGDEEFEDVEDLDEEETEEDEDEGTL